MNKVLTEHGQITLNQCPLISCQEVHVTWLLQLRLTGIFNTQTRRLVIIRVSKRYAQPVNQRGAVCHLTSSCNGSFHMEPGLMRCEALRKKQLDILMRDNCCTLCVIDLRSGVSLTKGTYKLTVWILSKKLIHHNNSWYSDYLYNCMEVILIPNNGWGHLMLHNITL